MKTKVYLKGMKPKEIETKFGVAHAVAYNCYKKGWIMPDYFKKEMAIPKNFKHLNIEELYKMCEAIFWQHFAPKIKGDVFQEKDDCVQAAMVRILELSGKYKKFFTIAKNAMRSWIRKQHLFL